MICRKKLYSLAIPSNLQIISTDTAYIFSNTIGEAIQYKPHISLHKLKIRHIRQMAKQTLCANSSAPVQFVKSFKSEHPVTLFTWEELQEGCEVKWKSLSHVRLFATPRTIQSMEILQARILEWVAFLFSRGSNQGSNPGLPYCRWILYQLSHKGSPQERW